MNEFITSYGEWGFVAGAAEGIGAAFSRSLARRGMNLIMLDNNYLQLNCFANDLAKLYKSKTICINADLSDFDAASEIPKIIGDLDCRLMVYVPAYSEVGPFKNLSERARGRFLSLNIRAPYNMVHAFLNLPKNGNNSGIILMSSLAAMVGPALVSSYAATKAFSLMLAESLYYELKMDRVDILACCAGPTSTPTFWKNNPGLNNKGIKIMQPADVAEYAIKMLGKNFYCIPGMGNRIIYFFLLHFLPRKIAVKIVSRYMLTMYRENKKGL